MNKNKRVTDAAWKKKEKTCISCTMYRGDVEDFRAWAAAQGKSINEALRDYVAACLGRPLERRDKLPTEEGESAAPEG